MSSKKDKALAGRITREIASKLLVRALMNAAALFDAAKILVARGHFGLARSQAISAREEIGKAFSVGTFLAGRITAEELVETLRSHKYKQAEGLIGPMLAGGLADSPELLESILPDGISPADVFTAMPGRLVAESDSLFAGLSPTLEAMRAVRETAQDGAHERARQAGIYVSLELDEAGIRLDYPQQISAEDAQEEIDRCDLLLSGLADLTGRLPSELWLDDEGAERYSRLAGQFLRPGMFGPPIAMAEGDDD